MRKSIFSALMLTAVCMNGFAQQVTDLKFVTEDGAEIADGSTITATETETSISGNLKVISGVYVKNTTGNIVQCSVAMECTDIDNGSISLCFPDQCMTTDVNGMSFETAKGSVKANATQSLDTEWIPETSTSYGSATVKYTLKIWTTLGSGSKSTDMFVGNGPTITVNYILGTTGINNTVSDKQTTSTEYYDLSGRKIEAPVKGVYVKVSSYSDGTKKSEKVIY